MIETNSIEGFRLSPQQRRVWSLQGAKAGTPYRAQCAVLIEGVLDRGLLRTALEDVVRRNEILRTRYEYFEGMAWPLQVIEEEAAISINLQDLTAFDCSAQEAEIERLSNEVGHEPFDFRNSSLFLCHLLVLSRDKHMLLLGLPALSADRKALEILVKEICSCYAARCCGQPLNPVLAQYADLSEWLNEVAETKESPIDFLRLDTDDYFKFRLPFGEQQLYERREFVPQSLHRAIPVEILDRMDAQARLHEVSVSSYFLTCWQILLGRITGASEMIVGCLSDCRTHEEASEALGLFAKYLPIRVRLEGKTSFLALLADVDRLCKRLAQSAEYFTLDRTEKLSTKTLLFPFGFQFEHTPPRNTIAKTSFNLLRQQAWVDRFKVQLCVHRSDSSSLEFQYDSSLYSEDEIRRLAGEFFVLLSHAARAPETKIRDLDSLSDEDRHQLLMEFNDTRRDYPKDRLIHEIFEQQAARYSDRIAVVCDNKRLTYGELSDRANRLAAHLRGLGVGPEVLVGICVERSLDLVVGILGILKAGGAWLPLDPVYPRERLAFMLADAQVRVIVSHSRLAQLLPQDGTRVLLDTEWPVLSGGSAEKPHGAILADNLAYVIYTSGSTGRPKGVAITHASLSHYVLAMADALSLTEEDTYLSTASISFSSSVRQLMLPLSLGATVVVASVNQIHNPLELFENIKSQGVRVIDIVPSYWRGCIQALAEMEEPKRADLLDNRLRLVLSASEPLHADLPQTWRRDLRHHARLINMFGQTETTGIVILRPIPEDLSAGTSLVGIGKPIPNTQIYLLDGLNQPLPIGVPGEISIGGADLSRGYVNQPDLTAERFVPNPFSREPGARLYRTGDLARHLPDGNLEFLGRLDDQVKIRGFRIEPAEIETLLREHPSVRQALVLPEDGKTGDRCLVAYVVLAQKGGATHNELRTYLEQKLPDYMVPASFVTIGSLPRTPTGKIDRRALLIAGSEKSRLELIASPPRNETERKLASMWAELLCLEALPGIDQDFFALGGQSLLATRLLLRVREAFEVNLDWRHFFQAPTIRGMAQWIEKMRLAPPTVASSSAVTLLNREEGEL